MQDYERMASAQGGACAACGLAPDVQMPLIPDHDPTTGTVRALLCLRCNLAIANFREVPDRLRRAAAYLREHAVADQAGRAKYRRYRLGKDYTTRYKPLFDALSVRQGHVCGVCGEPPSGKRQCAVLHMDHDHVSGLVRGLLCNACNRGIGQALDDPDRLHRLASYVTARESRIAA